MTDPPERSPAERKRPWEGAFLAALRETGNALAACQAAGVSRQVAYRYRAASPAFADAWADALEDAYDLFEGHAVVRATRGRRTLVTYLGEAVFVWTLGGEVVPPGTPGAVRVPLYEDHASDALLLALLRRHRRAEWDPPPWPAAAPPAPAGSDPPPGAAYTVDVFARMEELTREYGG